MGKMMVNDLGFDNFNSCCVPLPSRDAEVLRMLRILAVERRPEACFGCGLEHGCGVHGCEVINKAVALLER